MLGLAVCARADPPSWVQRQQRPSRTKEPDAPTRVGRPAAGCEIVGRSVVVAGRDDDDLFVRDEVDKTVLVVDAPRPSPRQVVFERLWLANAGEGVSAYVLDEFVDPDERLAVDSEPGCVVLPALVFEYQPHLSLPRGSAASGSMSWRSARLMPFRAFSYALSRRRAFAGERSR